MQAEPNQHNHDKHIEEDKYFSQDAQYVYVEEGTLMLLICSKCKLIESHCLHIKNSWNDGGTQLTCDLCGIDGT